MSNLKTEKLGVHASDLDLSKVPDIKLPEPAPDGRICVLSDKGYATVDLMETSQAFTDYSATCSLPVLDIGTAYGEVTVAALKKGSIVIANDVEQGSLDYIVKRKELTDDDRQRLYLKKGYVPKDMDFEPNSLGGIHASRVMHFFTPEEVQTFFTKAREWLVRDGVIFLVTSSPYHWFTPEGFGEEYEKKFKEGVEFPGIITDFSYIDKNLKTGGYNNAMDPKLIYREAVKNDFLIKKLGYEKGRYDYDYTFAILVNRKKE
uniref:Methyltransferase n=1 Tax=Piromyces sp. TaxID=45796 RepID=A0A2S1TZ29_PIRSP|nr:Methyltransferase [Piromyces sp.]